MTPTRIHVKQRRFVALTIPFSSDMAKLYGDGAVIAAVKPGDAIVAHWTVWTTRFPDDLVTLQLAPSGPRGSDVLQADFDVNLPAQDPAFICHRTADEADWGAPLICISACDLVLRLIKGTIDDSWGDAPTPQDEGAGEFTVVLLK